jgi:hypothetical protein
VQLDAHHARPDGGTEADREHSPQRDRHLAEDIAWHSFTDDALHPIHNLDGLNPAIEQREQRAIISLVRCELAGLKAYVRGRASKPLLLVHTQHREYLNPSDLVRRHHDVHPHKALTRLRAQQRRQPFRRQTLPIGT